jgi:hypothetical protein
MKRLLSLSCVLSLAWLLFCPMQRARAGCSSTNNSFFAYYPFGWEDAACSADTLYLWNQLRDLRSYGIDQAATRIMVDRIFDNASLAIDSGDDPHNNLHDNCHGKRVQLYNTHGEYVSSSGNTYPFVVAVASYDLAVDIAYSHPPAIARHSGSAVCKPGGVPLPAWNGVFLAADGVQRYITDEDIDPNALFMLFYCHSTHYPDLARTLWGNVFAQNGGTLVGFNGQVYTDDLRIVLGAGLSRLLCRNYQEDGDHHEVADAFGPWPVTVEGNQSNQLIKCGWACKDLGSHLSAAAFNDSIRWLVADEEEGASYVLRGRVATTADPETIATVAASPGSGSCQLKSYAMPYSATQYSEGDIMETSVSPALARGAGFDFDVRPSDWPNKVVGDATPLPACSGAREAPLDSVLTGMDSLFVAARIGDRSRDLPEDYYCADVVICGSSETTESRVLRVWEQVQQYHTSQGNVNKCRLALTNSNLATARSVYRDVATANFEYNEAHVGGGNRHYPVRPLMMLVGDDFLPMQLDDADGVCGLNGMCYSYSLVTDLDSDGTPDGATTLVPGATIEEVDAICHNADEFNSGDAEYVDPQRGVLLLGGDVPFYYHGDCTTDTSIPVGLSWVRSAYGNSYMPERGFLLLSDYGCPVDEASACEAGMSALAQGVRDVWVQGTDTGQRLWLPQLCNDVSVGRKQRVVLIGPSCMTASSYVPNLTGAWRNWMLRNRDDTAAACVLGLYHGGYIYQHWLLKDAILDAMLHSDGPILYAEIARRAAASLGPLYPEYAAGLTAIGAYVLYPSDLVFEGLGVGDDEQMQDSGVISVRRRAGSVELVLADRVGEIKEGRVFDVLGRSVPDGWSVSETRRSVLLDSRAMGTGVYLVRLEVRGPAETRVFTQKVVVVR